MFNFQQVIADRPLVMGVINVTPDSFSDGGQFFTKENVKNRIGELVGFGVDVIDIGPQSTRPGSYDISSDEEISRVELSLPIDSKTIFSLDTKSARTAKFGLENGFSIINDIAGTDNNLEMLKVIKELKAGYIIGHIKGNPSNMQNSPVYKDVVLEVIDSLKSVIESALEIGIDPKQLAVDPGIGFGKTFEQNALILDNLDRFKSLGYPVCVGVSRKSYIKQLLESSKVEVNEESLDQKSYEIFEKIRENIDIIRVHNPTLYCK